MDVAALIVLLVIAVIYVYYASRGVKYPRGSIPRRFFKTGPRKRGYPEGFEDDESFDYSFALRNRDTLGRIPWATEDLDPDTHEMDAEFSELAFLYRRQPTLHFELKRLAEALGSSVLEALKSLDESQREFLREKGEESWRIINDYNAKIAKLIGVSRGVYWSHTPYQYPKDLLEEKQRVSIQIADFIDEIIMKHKDQPKIISEEA